MLGKYSKCQRGPEIEKKKVLPFTDMKNIRFPSVEKLLYDEEFHELIVFQSFAFHVKNSSSVLCLVVCVTPHVQFRLNKVNK